MRTEKDLVEMVEKYRTDYPWLQTRITDEMIQGIRHLEDNFGIMAMDDLYETLEAQIVVEIKTRALTDLGVPVDEAFQKVWKEQMGEF